MAAASLLFSANSFATMSCGHVDNGDGTTTYKCSSTLVLIQEEEITVEE